MDYKIRMTAADDTVRAFAITARDTVEEARICHDLAPVAAAALGRTICGASMMAMMEKESDNLLTIQLLGNGPLKGVTVSANPAGLLKGFVNEGQVELPPKSKGKLDVGRAIGSGILRVMRDTGAPEPYIGSVPLVNGEIAEDLTYYFAQSEQTPSAVGLGVLVDKDLSISCAGGFILQLMPDASDSTIDSIEKNVANIHSVTDMLSRGQTPEQILSVLLDGLCPTLLEKQNVAYTCDCSREKVVKSLISLREKDLKEMIEDEKPIEVRCDFCGKTYNFSPKELDNLAHLSEQK